MRILVVILLAVAFSATGSNTAIAQDYAALLRDFHAGNLTRQDKRFLQAALAFEGHYNGLIDGDWGRMSQSALEGYARKEFGGPAQDWHMAMLALAYFKRFENDGWIIDFSEPLGLSFLFPSTAAAADPSTEFFVNWHHRNSSLAYSVAVANLETTSRFHDFTLSRHERDDAPYVVRRPGFAVSSTRSKDGSILYTRSNLVDGHWSTVMLSSEARDEATLNAVAASISVGRSDPLMFTEGGRLHEAVMNIFSVAEGENGQDQSSGSVGSAPSSEPYSSAGTGFVVSEQGHVLTNAHVIGGCDTVTVNGSLAKVISVSEEFDLALLAWRNNGGKFVAVFSTLPAKLNSDVTVAGYPYAGLLGGLNVTRGSVSSVQGLGGKGTQMQITAPVQSGNSGGPVISTNGEVVGVVVSKLDAAVVADVIGDTPQNVNFAIRGEIAKLFLFQNGIEPRQGKSEERLAPVDIAELASNFTVFVECN